MQKKLLIPILLVTGFLLLSGVGLLFLALNNSGNNLNKVINEAEAIAVIQSKYPELQGYPSANLPPKSIKTEIASEGLYIAFIQEGSGVPVISASCFLYRADRSISQIEYVKDSNNPAGDFSPKSCKVISTLVGGDRDAHGCIGSAGYSWCESKQKCLRSWEESCDDLPGTATCGITNCHGLDISCGTGVPKMCTMIYQLGDRCRQYAQCAVVNGTCQQIENTRFTQCVACVHKCLETNVTDATQQFTCESQCQ